MPILRSVTVPTLCSSILLGDLADGGAGNALGHPVTPYAQQRLPAAWGQKNHTRYRPWLLLLLLLLRYKPTRTRKRRRDKIKHPRNAVILPRIFKISGIGFEIDHRVTAQKAVVVCVEPAMGEIQTIPFPCIMAFSHQCLCVSRAHCLSLLMPDSVLGLAD
ncbi:hypothetical protein BD289DRAFT_75089 [Coniella lustricola]|uniref:Uncharacterized protein n=1 Tax=Coniella lustricola TaxID=2025994 RepID=A0A2T3AHP8_9PEZI|nr:hypothetical protein BD289DRAFT_75089 [Coniella lustricola]